MTDKIERKNKKKKLKISRGDPQKAMNFFNQAMTTGQPSMSITGAMGEELKERKQINILITIDFPYTPTAESLAEDAIDEGNRSIKRDRFASFIVNAMGHLERKGYEIFDEHQSDTPRSLSYYITTIKSDDLKGNDIKVVVFIRLSDHPLQKGGIQKRQHYIKKLANNYKTASLGDDEQPWTDINIVAKGSSISDFGDALDQLDKGLEYIDKKYYNKVDEAIPTERIQKIERNLPKVKRGKNESLELNEMALSRQDAIDRCMGLGKKFAEHFDKIYNSKDKKLIDHWAKEMDAWWDQVKDIRMKPRSKRIYNVDLLDWFFDAGQLATDFMTSDDIFEEREKYEELEYKLLGREKTVVELIEEMFPINESLNETTTSRVFQHIKSGEPWAIVSPYRYEYSDDENRHRMTELKADVRGEGYGFIHLISRWVEDGIAFDEESLLIPKCSEEDAITLGKKFEQSSVIVSHDGRCVEICTNPFENYSEGEVVRTFNLNNETPMNIKDAEEIFSKRKGGPVSKPKSKRAKPFTLKEVLVVENPRPSYFHTRRRVEERTVKEDANKRDFKNFSIEIPYKDLEVAIGWHEPYFSGGSWESGYDITDEFDYDYEIGWDEFYDYVRDVLVDTDDDAFEYAEELGYDMNDSDDVDMFFDSQDYKNYVYDHAEEILKDNLTLFQYAFEEYAIEACMHEHENYGPDDYYDDI